MLIANTILHVSLQRFRPEPIQSKLRSAAAESDELSESIAQSFLEGKLDQDGFIRQYRELRKVYHLREMKNERIGPILRDHSTTSSSNTTLGPTGPDGLGSKLKGGTGAGMAFGPSANPGSGPGEGSGGMSGHVASNSDTWVVL